MTGQRFASVGRSALERDRFWCFVKMWGKRTNVEATEVKGMRPELDFLCLASQVSVQHSMVEV